MDSQILIPRGSWERWRLPLLVGLPTAVMASSAGLLLHHLPVRRLTLHEVEAVLLLAVGAVVIALLPAVLASGRAPALPRVVRARGAACEVGPLGRDELELAAALHADALRAGFLVGLGHRFVMAYQATFVDSPHAVALVARTDGAFVGMLLGVLDPVAHRRWLLRHRALRLARMGASALLVRPRATATFLRTRTRRYATALRGRGRTPSDAAAPTAGRDPEVPAVLSHVAALPGARGMGVGGALVDAFVHAAREAGARRARLATITGPDGAGAFYRHRGWEPSGTVVDADGVGVELFDLPLDDGGRAA